MPCQVSGMLSLRRLATEHLSSKLLFVLLLLACVLLPTATLSGGSPAQVCRDYPYAEVAFVGTLTDFTRSSGDSSMRFEAIEPLTGESISSITLHQPLGSICRGSRPAVGGRYLVFAGGLGGSALGSYTCDELKREADATVDIEYLRLAESGLTPTEVSGEVRITGGGPIKGAKVHLARTDAQKELTSDKNGHFHVELQPGTYLVTADFPKGLEAEDCGWATLIVMEHRCIQTVICAKPKTPKSTTDE
jgi:hypothetical protein